MHKQWTQQWKERKNHVSSPFLFDKQGHVTYSKSVLSGATIRCCAYLWIRGPPVPVVMRFVRTLPSKLLVTTAVLVQKYLMTCSWIQTRLSVPVFSTSSFSSFCPSTSNENSSTFVIPNRTTITHCKDITKVRHCTFVILDVSTSEVYFSLCFILYSWVAIA